MHVSFVTYGARQDIENFLRDMESQKFLMPMIKGKKKRGAWINGQVRELPFGIREYVFTREARDMVLRTLNANAETTYGVNLKKLVYPFLRKLLKLKPIPKYEKEGNVYLWRRPFMSLVVLGVREDADVVGEYVDDKGWTHEAL